jgi:hypothetical protein
MIRKDVKTLAKAGSPRNNVNCQLIPFTIFIVLMLDDLEWLREQLPHGPICLILGQYHTHDTAAFQAKADGWPRKSRFFLQLGDQVQGVKISFLDTVQSLEQFLPPAARYVFYFDDFEISPAFSLKYASMLDSGVIRAVALTPETQQTSLLTKPPSKAKERGHIKDEITDQFYKHVEGTVTSYRRLVRRFLTCHRQAGARRTKVAETVIREVAACPATTDLPRF